jgi:hypothetical protein
MKPRLIEPLEHVVCYDLEEYSQILEPFCNYLVSPEGFKFTLGDNNETGKLNLWDEDRLEVRLMAALFDTAVLDYLNKIHPRFKGNNRNYKLEKDGWLTSILTKQHVVKHTHVPPYIREEDVGDVITVFYVYLDETIGPDNGPLEFFANKEDENPLVVWTPKRYNLVIMLPEIWHRARPFIGTRYSLATDIKVSEL